ncbi:MAG: four helix bundle protein [Ignavibacteriales bacterium]|nr:four helix bundle protein [Ignavibacteriales bacterium]
MKVFEKQIGYGNPILEKSFDFAVKITKYYVESIKKDYLLKDILRQLLRSGTSIGANVSESQEAVSKKDFINKLSIALKEAKETEYWLKILFQSCIINENLYNELINECHQIIRILVSILKKLKENDLQ